MLPSLTALLSIRKLEIVNIRDGATEKREDLQCMVYQCIVVIFSGVWLVSGSFAKCKLRL